MTSQSSLTEPQRVELICEAIRYCQRVRAMGMVSAAWSKALREPIYFMWAMRNGNKASAARYRSVAAAGLMWGAREVVYDHAIPIVLVQNALMGLSKPQPEGIRAILDRMLVACIITERENRLISAKSLGMKMPPDWDGIDPLAR